MVEKAFNWEFLVHFISFDEVYHFSSILWNKKICMCFISIQTLNNNSWNLHWLLFSHVQLFVTPWTAAHQASLFFTISLSLLKFISIESMMPFNHLILCCPIFSCPESFQQQGLFPLSQLLASGDQSIGSLASALVLPMSIQGWFPLGLAGWSPCCPRGSQESSPVSQLKSMNSLAPSLLYCPNITSIHDYWNSHGFHLYGPLLANWCLCFLICCLGLL